MVVLVAVAVAAVGFSRLGVGSPRSTPRPTGPTGSTGPLISLREVSTEATLRSQAAAVRDHDRAGYLADWVPRPSARRTARLTYSNLGRLGIARISPRLSLPSLRDHAATWTAQVDVTWRLNGLEAAGATSALSYTFRQSDGRTLISGIRPLPADRQPIWLLPGLHVRRGARTLVAATSTGIGQRVARLLPQAVTAVGRVLPGWHGGLVAYAPASAREFAALTGASPGQYRGIAAVTTTVDGSSEAATATAIVVNPRVFAGLGPVGAHVVITHEATHAATHAAVSSMPLWLAEGFADYVGIGSVHLTVAAAAKAALNVVRRTGAPPSLPQDAAFAVDGNHLEATYEEAWLATSLIARTYGRQRLVALYRAVERQPDELDGAFERILDTTVSSFTASWRRYLEETARAG